MALATGLFLPDNHPPPPLSESQAYTKTGLLGWRGLAGFLKGRKVAYVVTTKPCLRTRCRRRASVNPSPDHFYTAKIRFEENETQVQNWQEITLSKPLLGAANAGFLLPLRLRRPPPACGGEELDLLGYISASLQTILGDF